MKVDILTSLRVNISVVIRSELKNVLSEDFSFLKIEMKELRSKIANNMVVIRSDMDKMKTTISDVEVGLSTWSDEFTARDRC